MDEDRNQAFCSNYNTSNHGIWCKQSENIYERPNINYAFLLVNIKEIERKFYENTQTEHMEGRVTSTSKIKNIYYV